MLKKSTITSLRRELMTDGEWRREKHCEPNTGKFNLTITINRVKSASFKRRYQLWHAQYDHTTVDLQFCI